MKNKQRGIILTLLIACWISACDGHHDNPVPTPQPTTTKVSVQPGCYSATYSGYASSQVGCGILPSFGDQTFDAAFSQEVSLQQNFWTGNPAVVYAFDECSGQMNALSFPQHFILFGRNLVVSTIMNTGNTLAIAGELAHEWGHQVQYNNGYINNNSSTSRNTELEADAFGGFYLGLAKGWAGTQLNSYLQSLASLGTYDFTNPSFHGTPSDRASAGALGLSVAAYVINTNTPLSYNQLHSIFTTSAPIAKISAREVKELVDRSIEAQARASVDQNLIQRIASGEASLDEVIVPNTTDIKREELRPF